MMVLERFDQLLIGLGFLSQQILALSFHDIPPFETVFEQAATVAPASPPTSSSTIAISSWPIP